MTKGMICEAKFSSAILSLICFLAAIYLLSYTGKPISDDEQLYISATRNIAEVSRLGAEQLYGNLRLKGDYHGVEPGHPVLASLWLPLFPDTNFGKAQLLYLLPILYTIFACVLIVVFAGRLGYSIPTGVVTALLYGLSTLAWPYAKTFLREPLLVILLLGSWLTFLTMTQTANWKKYVYGLLFFILIVTLVLVKVVYVAVWGAFFILWQLDEREKGRKLFGRMIWQLLLIVTVLVISGLIFTRGFTEANTYYRFSGAFVYDIFVRLFFISHSRFWEAILGSLISPLKGLIYYSPVILLALMSLILNFRKRPQLFVLPITMLTSLLLVQTLAFDGEWWTPTWGNRFLLPIISIFMIASLPVIDDLLIKIKRGKMILAGIFILGVLIQLPAVLFNSSKFFAQTYDYEFSGFVRALWDPSLSPILLQWRMANIPEYDLLIWRVFPEQGGLVMVFIFGVAGAAIMSIYWLFRTIMGDEISRKNLSFRLLIVSGSVSFLVLCILLLGRYDPYYRIPEFKQLCDKLRVETQPGDLVIMYSYPGELWDFLSNSECWRGVWYSLPYNYYLDTDSQAYHMAEDLFKGVNNRQHTRLWFLSQYDFEPLADFEKAVFTNDEYLLLDERYFIESIPVYLALYEIRR